MIDAAHELFITRGYSGATMNDIAARAGVAVQTLYFTFHRKPELLQACYELAVLGRDDPKPPPMQPWWAKMMSAPTGPDAIRHFVAGNLSILKRVGVLDDIVRSAVHEAEAVEVRRHSEYLRRDGFHGVVRHLRDRFGLRDGLTIDTAVDLLLMLSSPMTYRTLVLDYGWREKHYSQWLTETLISQLLAP
jgi:AcrR family transcriptional regulator